jgi:hypothetical protein
MRGVEVTNQWADLEMYAQQGRDPVGIISRGAQEEWQIAKGPIKFDRPMEWWSVRDGDAVYVPLVPYLVSTVPEEAFAYLLEIGVMAGIQVNMTRGPIRRIHLIRGKPAEDLRPETNAFRCWVGLAIRIK